MWSCGESSPLGGHGLALPSSCSLLPETAARDLEGQVHIPPARCACGALEAGYYMEKVAMLPRGACPAKYLCCMGAMRSAVTVKLVCPPRHVAFKQAGELDPLVDGLE